MAHGQQQPLHLGTPSAEERLATTERLARIGSYLWWPERDTVVLSEQARTILGLHDQASDVGAFAHLLTRLSEDDRAHLEAAVAAALGQGRPIDLTYAVHHADGAVRTIRERGRCVRGGSGELRLEGTVQDVTELQRRDEMLAETAARAEQTAAQLQEILESITDGFGTLGHDWRITSLNERAAELLGMDTGDLVGRRLGEAFPTWSGSELDLAYRRAAVDQQRQRTTIFYPPTERWLQRTIYPAPHGLTVYLTDVSEQVEREQRLQEVAEAERRAAHRARELDQLKSTILTAVSHELRTPLTIVHGLVETIARHPERLAPTERDLLVQRTFEHTQRLVDLLDDLLDLDRLSRDGTRRQRSEVDLATLLREVVAVSDVHARVEIDAPETLRRWVDATQVERLLDNLLHNAAKYAPDGPVLVRLRSDDATGACIEVLDRGPGIPETELEAIFEPFHRVHQDHPQPGTGIGLSLVARFAELHGGRASAHRREGGGAHFVVELPGGPVDAPERAEHRGHPRR